MSTNWTDPWDEVGFDFRAKLKEEDPFTYSNQRLKLPTQTYAEWEKLMVYIDHPGKNRLPSNHPYATTEESSKVEEPEELARFEVVGFNNNWDSTLKFLCHNNTPDPVEVIIRKLPTKPTPSVDELKRKARLV